MLKNFISTRWFHPLLLLVWMAIGAGLRLTNLTAKPPWTDEFATLVFSLGNSFKTVPVDQAISLDALLQPLRLNPTAGTSAVIQHLITEDHHPPLYFVLAHWWMQLFPGSGGYVSLWAARSLPALLGVASIPAVYGLGFLAFRRTLSCPATLSRLVAQLAAAMMAVSPYGVFLTQEARHYALGILWVIASLCCLVVAVQNLQRRTSLPIGVALCWVVVNSLGIATHYFFCFTLGASAIVLIGFWILEVRLRRRSNDDKAPELGRQNSSKAKLFPTPQSHWWRIGAVAIGTLVGCLVWVPVWLASHDSQMTQWIMRDGSEAGSDRLLGSFLSLINPIFQALATWITMVSLLPLESSSLLVVIASGLVMLVFFIWAVPILYRGLKAQLEQPDSRLAIGILGGFVLGAIAIIFSITYFLGADLTRGARYSFVYFPAVPVILGAMLAVSWSTSKVLNSKSRADTVAPPLQKTKPSLPYTHNPSRFRTNGKPAVALIWLMGLLSSITVISNLGYRKYYRPDLLVPIIQQASSVPILIATTHNTLVQTGEMMGIAWEFKRATDLKKSPVKAKFLLAHQDQDQCVSVQGTTCQSSKTLKKTLAQLPRPLDLWLVNFKAPVEPEAPYCFAEDTSQYQTSVNGYSARLYHCLADNSEASRRL